MKRSLSDFIFEASTLKNLQRTGWQILGEGKESVAEHSFMVSVISYALVKLFDADMKKVLLMSLFHDFSESRIGDIYKLADLYVRADSEKAFSDAFSNFSDDELVEITKEYENGETMEAKIVHDADTLALCVELKKMMENGNKNAKEWYNANLKRLKLDKSKEVLKEMTESNSQNWWKREREKIHKSF